jgi:hypothetical protein
LDKGTEVTRGAVLGFKDHVDIAIKFNGLTFGDCISVWHAALFSNFFGIDNVKTGMGGRVIFVGVF